MPTAPTLDTHNLLLSDGTTTIGLLFLVDPKTSLPLLNSFHRRPAPPLGDQQFQDSSEAIFRPEYQGYDTQDTWHGGFGKQNHAPNRYMQTTNTNASLKGLIHTSPIAVATTHTPASYAPAASGTNLGFETGDFTGWVAGTDWSVVSTGTPQAGTYHARYYQPSVTTTRYLRQTLLTTDSIAFDGMTLTVEVWSKLVAGTMTTATITLTDASNAVLFLTVILSQTASYVKTTLTHVFTDPVDQVKIEIAVAGNATTEFYVDGFTISLTGTAFSINTAPNTVVKLLDFNSQHYLVSDSGVWNRTANNWARVANSPPGIMDAVADDTYLYLTRGWGNKTWYMDTSEVFRRIDSSNSEARQIGWINGSMYAYVAWTTLRKFTSITAGTIAADYTVGSPLVAANAILNYNELPTIIKENWGGYIKANAVVQIAQELASLSNNNTGKNTIAWRGDGLQTLYIPAGAGASLLAYETTNVRDVGPNQFAERLTNYKGQVVATASDDQWLFIILDDGTQIQILKGRYETIDGVTDVRWHPFAQTPYTTVAGAMVSSITAKRLYFWGGTALPQYVPLPVQYGDPLNDTNLTHKTGGTFETCWLDKGLPNVPKTFLTFTLSSLSLSGTARTVKVEYMLWENQAWVELGGTGEGSFNISPLQTKPFASGVSGRKIRFRFSLYTDNTANGVGIIQFTYRYALKPLKLNTFTARIKLSNKNLLLNTGAEDTEMTYGIVSSQLHAWKDEQPLTLTYPDGLLDGPGGIHDGATASVKFAGIFPEENLTFMGRSLPDGSYEAPESIVDLVFIELDRTG